MLAQIMRAARPATGDEGGMAPETAALLAGLEPDAVVPASLDALVRALVDAGIWGTLGRIGWARDAAGGTLLLWEPAA